jgi:REP element-mobilizing transposase RayT
MFERSFRAAMERAGFAITQYSIQRDHIHVVVEVADKQSLARGMQALAIRIAKQLNSAGTGRAKVESSPSATSLSRSPPTGRCGARCATS